VTRRKGGMCELKISVGGGGGKNMYTSLSDQTLMTTCEGLDRMEEEGGATKRKRLSGLRGRRQYLGSMAQLQGGGNRANGGRRKKGSRGR